MNRSLLVRFSAIAALSLAAVASTAKAGHLPRPLGDGYQPLSPGVHVLDLVSREHPPGSGPKHLPRIAITLPKGWFNYDGWGINDGGTLVVSFWDVAKVYPTGCKWRSKPMVNPGRTVDGLARALATRPLRHASKPRSVALDGFHGKYLSWSVPNKIDFGRCDQGYFESWTAKGWSSDRYQQDPGQVDGLWILDVKGQRLLIDAAYEPWATRKQRAELGRIVHSIKFLSDSSRRPVSAPPGHRKQHAHVYVGHIAQWKSGRGGDQIPPEHPEPQVAPPPGGNRIADVDGNRSDERGVCARRAPSLVQRRRSGVIATPVASNSSPALT